MFRWIRWIRCFSILKGNPIDLRRSFVLCKPNFCCFAVLAPQNALIICFCGYRGAFIEHFSFEFTILMLVVMSFLHCLIHI